MTGPPTRHCEERSDEAIQSSACLPRIHHRSRGALRPSFANHHDGQEQRKEKRETKRRKAHPAMAAPYSVPAPLRGRVRVGVGSGSRGSRSPSGAPQRRLPERANAPAQPRPRFTRTTGCGRYPRHRSRLSKAPCAPVVMPAGTLPRPPGSGVTSSARRNRTRPIDGCRRRRPFERARRGGYGQRGGKVKGFKFAPMNQGVSRSVFF